MDTAQRERHHEQMCEADIREKQAAMASIEDVEPAGEPHPPSAADLLMYSAEDLFQALRLVVRQERWSIAEEITNELHVMFADMAPARRRRRSKSEPTPEGED